MEKHQGKERRSIATPLGVGLLVAVVVLTSVVLGGSVYADARDRDARVRDGDSGRAAPTTPSPEPAPVPPPAPSLPKQGGISSETNGTADSGGNVGGDVITGDESVTVIEINIGPTNPPSGGGATDPSSGDSGTGSEEEDTQCDGRTRAGCFPGGDRIR